MDNFLTYLIYSLQTIDGTRDSASKLIQFHCKNEENISIDRPV
jgi:hypothetical protein